MICEPCRNGDHCGPPGVPGPCQTCQHRPRGTGQDAAQPPVSAVVDPSPVSVDPEPPTHGPQGRTADPDVYLSPGFNQVVKDVPTTTLLADWMHAVRAGQEARAAIVHGALISRIRRLA